MRFLLALVLFCWAGAACAQAPEGMLSGAEVDQIRDAAQLPNDTIKVYVRILDDRAKAIERLLAGRRGAAFAVDLHEEIEQMGAIADELNDHLDVYAAQKRDVRKGLPKLRDAADRWATVLRAPPDNARYDVMRKTALDTLKDTRTLVDETMAAEVAYFKEHPEAAKAEAERAADPSRPD